MPTLAERFIEKRSKMSERLKKIKDKLADEEEYTSSNDLKDVPIIFIGDHSFRNNEIVALFTPDNKKEETLVLFKKVFQNKYPITRHNGIPRVPSREEDKNLLVDGLNKYFNLLRNEIISLKKKGDSVDLREKISHLQKINILITHFKEDKETFPYQDFDKYLSNKDYINSVGDIDDGLRSIKGEEKEEERVRNLLRQFIKVYLQNKKAQDYGLHGDGIYSEQFQEFKEEYKGKIPQIFIYLMETLEDEAIRAPEKSEYDFTSIYKKLEDLRNKFAEAEKEKDPAFPTQSGGLIPDVKKENLEDTIQEVVDYMIEEYIKLKTGYDSVLRESLNKDATLASYKTTISKKTDTISKALEELKSRREKIDDLDEAIKKYLEQLSRKNTIIRKLVSKCRSKGISGDTGAILPSSDNNSIPIDIFGNDYNKFGEEDEDTPSRRFDGINMTDRADSISGKPLSTLNTIPENSENSENYDNPNIAREILSNIASLPSPERIELIEDIRNSPSIDNSVNILKDFYKKQQLIDQDWSPEIFDSVIKKLIERLKTARDTKAADKIFTEPKDWPRPGYYKNSEKPYSYYNNNNNNDGTTVWSQDDFDRQKPENYYNAERQENIRKKEQQEKQNSNNSYSGVRGMFDPEFEEEPKKSSTPSAREDPPTEWILKNVRGDGNCFYRALYNAALRYYGGPIVSDIYECFGINNGVENEEQFIRSMRNSIGDKILNGIYDQKAANTNGNNQGMYEILHDGALADVNGTNPNSGNKGTFEGMFSALSQGFSREIKDKYPNAETMAKETKENFYKFLSDTVKRDKVYASQYDIDLVKWILNKCNSPININIQNNENLAGIQKDLDSLPKYRTFEGKRTINLLNKGEYHYNYFYEEQKPQGTPTITLENAFELLNLNKDEVDRLIEEKQIPNIFSAIDRKYERSEKERKHLRAKDIIKNYVEDRIAESREFTDNNVEKYEFDTAISILGLNGIKPLTHAMINKKYRQLARTKHTNKGGDTGEFQELENSKTLLLKLSEQQIQEYLNMQGGGSKESKLLEYSRKVADNRLKEFLKEEPLPLFTLIEEFENSSNLKVIEKGNEKHIFETFLNYMFDQFFSSEEGKQFYFEAYEILNKKKYFETAALCFVILENINAIQSSRKDIDTVRMSSSEYNAMFDEFEQNLKEANYDFFTEASKLVPNKISIKFFKDHIYFHNNTDSFEKTFTINNNLDIDKEHYDFNEELYFVNNSTIYLFFIISSYLYMKPNVKLSLEDSINKFSRKMKRTKNKKTKSIKMLLKERKEFNNEELDGEED